MPAGKRGLGHASTPCPPNLLHLPSPGLLTQNSVTCTLYDATSPQYADGPYGRRLQQNATTSINGPIGALVDVSFASIESPTQQVCAVQLRECW